MDITVDFLPRYPSRSQERLLEQTLETCRRWYNTCLEERKTAWEKRRERISQYDQPRKVKDLKDTNPYAEKVHISNRVKNYHLSKSIMDAGWGYLKLHLTHPVVCTQGERQSGRRELPRVVWCIGSTRRVSLTPVRKGSCRRTPYTR